MTMLRFTLIFLSLYGIDLTASQGSRLPLPSEQAAAYDTQMARSLQSYITAPWKWSAQDWYTQEKSKLREQFPTRFHSISDYREYIKTKNYLQAERDAARDIERLHTALKNTGLAMTYLPSVALVAKMACTTPPVQGSGLASLISKSSCMRFLMHPTTIFSLGFAGLLARAAYERGQMGYTADIPQLTNLQEQFYF